jgi:hypothetical protein
MFRWILLGSVLLLIVSFLWPVILSAGRNVASKMRTVHKETSPDTTKRRRK